MNRLHRNRFVQIITALAQPLIRLATRAARTASAQPAPRRSSSGSSTRESREYVGQGLVVTHSILFPFPPQGRRYGFENESPKRSPFGSRTRRRLEPVASNSSTCFSSTFMSSKIFSNFSARFILSRFGFFSFFSASVQPAASSHRLDRGAGGRFLGIRAEGLRHPCSRRIPTTAPCVASSPRPWRPRSNWTGFRHG